MLFFLKILDQGAKLANERGRVPLVNGGIGWVDLDQALSQLSGNEPDAVRVSLNVRVAGPMKMAVFFMVIFGMVIRKGFDENGCPSITDIVQKAALLRSKEGEIPLQFDCVADKDGAVDRHGGF